MEETTMTYLSDQQHARVEALKEAKGVLSSSGSMFSVRGVDARFTHYNLMTVATYILTGNDGLEGEAVEGVSAGFTEEVLG